MNLTDGWEKILLNEHVCSNKFVRLVHCSNEKISFCCCDCYKERFVVNRDCYNKVVLQLQIASVRAK